MTEEPVEIELRLNQDIDSEGKKVTDSIQDVAAASEKMRSDFEANIKAQQEVIKMLTAEVSNLKKMLEAQPVTKDKQLIADKQKLTSEVASLTAQLAEAEKTLSNMQSKYQAASKSIISDTEKMTSATRDYVFANKDELAESINVQKKVIADLKNQITAAQAKMKENSAVAYSPRTFSENQKLTQIIANLNKELQQESDALAELQGRSQSFGQKSASLETQIRQVREAMAQLKIEGRQNSQEYAELEKRLQVLGTTYREVYNTQKALSTGGSQMAGILSGLSALSGLLAAGGGAFGILNNESERFQQIQTKVQSLMAITIGLQQVSNSLHKTSAFRITTVATAKNLWAAATNRLSVALGVSNVAAQVLMTTLTLGLSVAITAIIAVVSTFTKRQREAAQETAKLNASVSDMAGSTLATFAKLKKGFQDLNGDVQKQAKYLSENKKEFDGLGVAVNSVNDAERLFSNQGSEAFKKAIIARAKAVAVMDLAAEKYKVIVQKMLEAESMPDTIVKRSPILMPGQTQVSTYRTNNTAKKKLKIEQEEAEAEFESLIKKAIAFEGEFYSAMSMAGKPTEAIAEYTKAYWEKQKNDAQKALDLMTDAQKGTADWIKQKKLLDEATKKLETWDFTEPKTGGKDKKENAIETLRKTSIELQYEVDAAVIAAMQEGAVKQLAETEAAYNKRRDTISEKLREIEKLEKASGIPATGQRNLIANLLEAETAKFMSEKKVIEIAAQKEVDAIFSDVNQRFSSQLQNQLNNIDAYYTEHLQKLRKNVTDSSTLQSLIADLENKRTRERTITSREAALKTIDFEEEIALTRQEISSRDLTWEADKQKRLLEIQISFANRRMNALNDIKLSGGDAEEEIARLRLEIERLNNELNKTDGNKLKQIAETLSGSLRRIGSELSGIPGKIGEIGQAMTGLADNANNIATIFDKTTSKKEKIEAGVDGLASLFRMVAGQIAENKELQEQWNVKIREATHQAALARIELQAYQEGNIFGIENPYAKAIAGAAEYAASIKELQNMAGLLAKGQVQTGTTKKVSGSNIMTGVGAGASAGAAIGSIVPGIGTGVGAVVGGIVGGIVGLFAKKTVPVFESLAQKYGDIYNKDTFELNPKVLDDYAKLDDATKELVDNWQEIKEKAKGAEQQMRDTFRDLAGDIGTQLSDALVNAFRNNDLTTAMNKFEGGVTKIIENIIAQMVFATFFEEMLKDLEEGMKASFKEGSDGSIIDDILRFTEQYNSAIPEYYEALKSWQEEMRKLGIDAFAPDNSTRSATPKGIAQASQDTVDELNGRITNIQQMIFDIRSNSNQNLSVNNELLNHQKAIRSQIDVIADNSKHLQRLEKIENNLNDISLKGLKIRT